MTDQRPSVLIALGGNALDVKDINTLGIDPNHRRPEFSVARQSMESVGNLLQSGEVGPLIITHGNGPQVGRIYLQQELTRNEFPRQVTLDVCVADSQGRIGVTLQNVLNNVCKNGDIPREIATMVTQVVVDQSDPAFENPTKPIGGFYSEEEAKEFIAKGQTFKEDAGRGWRKVVPSPMPVDVVEKKMIKRLFTKDNIIIAAGGGGVPVFRNNEGELRGVEAVLDKDRTSSFLANELGVDLFMILTEAPFVSLNYNTPEQVDLKEVKVSELEKYMNEGHFAEGSMKPKVEAAINFVKRGGKKAIIANLFDLLDAYKGKKGTQVYPD